MLIAQAMKPHTRAFERRSGHKWQTPGCGDKTKLIAENAEFAKLYARHKGLRAQRDELP